MSELTEAQRESLVYKLLESDKKLRDTFTYEFKLREQDLLELNRLDREILLNEIEFIKNCIIKNQF